MIDLTLADIARITGGRVVGATDEGTRPEDLRVTGSVEFDSRRLGPGSLFVALPGERADGHDFAATAYAAGAVAVLGSRDVGGPAVLVEPDPSGHAAEAAPHGSYVLAADHDGGGAAVLGALAALARAVVDALPELTVVGLTGSSGKTSTKDLIAGLLERGGPTVAPPGSFNNELGHPWSVLRADEHTRHLVCELSARGRGHIAALCRVAPPRIGAVINVGSAHLGEFGSREAIATAKGELVEALPAAADGGVAVLGADDPVVAAMARRTAARVVHAGRAPAAQVRATDETLDSEGRPAFRLVTPVGEVPVALGLRGAHQVDNALVAAAVALECGIDLDQIALGLAAAAPRSPWRMAVGERPDGVRVINDAYNANPESMGAALTTLAAMTGRRVAVLGEMGELGDTAADAHAEVGRRAAGIGVERLLVVGEGARPLHDAARAAGVASELVPDAAAAAARMRELVRPEDVVLVKGSRAVGLETVAESLLADTGAGDTGDGDTGDGYAEARGTATEGASA